MGTTKAELPNMGISGNGYVIDIENGAETARLIEQDRLFTHAMGGLLPEQPDLSSIKRILDIGCGPGGWVNNVAFEYQGIQVYGIDSNHSMVTYAKAIASVQGLDNAHFKVMDARNPLDFDDHYFDLVNARFMAGFLDQASWPTLLAE
ncbi:MAG: class I SAM-dependent methyltransferase, partial [Ktedonobacteraceae bacterium]|nr:class I SAM-dependent methyltransferase [Ktedonobacteraceae bacterium]